MPEEDQNQEDFFYRLTPDLVMEAVEQSGLRPSSHCRALNSLENRVFDIGLEDGSHMVAKFYRPGRWSYGQILEEHEFLFDLRDAEIPVLYPVLFPDGKSINTISNIHYAIWPLTGGREPSEFSDEELEITGRLLARIHNVGASKKASQRPILTSGRLGIEPMNYLLENKFIPEPLCTRYYDAVMKTAEAYDTLSQTIPVHRIHGDCHIGNLLFGRQGWYFLDFDDFCMGPAVQDIWMISSGRSQADKLRQNIFLDAYRTFRDFDDSWLKLIEPLRSLRYIHYSSWIAKRWKDPAFPLAFPHFGAEEYWVSELNDLEEQLTFFSGSHSTYFFEKPSDSEPELTNKDFFWDM
jgi:Ser/Thr protein kinase RdoA (MazF antagonist)